MILVRVVNQVLCLNVRRKIIRDEIVIAVVDDTIYQGRKRICVAEFAAADSVKDALQSGVELEA